MSITSEFNEERLNAVYTERNSIVAFLSKLYPASLELDKETLSQDWKWVVIMDLPTGQASWHIHINDLPLFAHLPKEAGRMWDGHTTEQKYAKINSLTPQN